MEIPHPMTSRHRVSLLWALNMAWLLNLSGHATWHFSTLVPESFTLFITKSEHRTVSAIQKCYV